MNQIIKKNILVVEDELCIRNTFKKYLQKHFSVNVDTAESAEEGLQLFNDTIYSLVLMDFRLPKMNGLELLFKIKDSYPSTKTIIASGSFYPFTSTTMAKTDGFLIKPFEFHELKQLVTKLL